MHYFVNQITSAEQYSRKGVDIEMMKVNLRFRSEYIIPCRFMQISVVHVFKYKP